MTDAPNNGLVGGTGVSGGATGLFATGRPGAGFLARSIVPSKLYVSTTPLLLLWYADVISTLPLLRSILPARPLSLMLPAPFAVGGYHSFPPNEIVATEPSALYETLFIGIGSVLKPDLTTVPRFV